MGKVAKKRKLPLIRVASTAQSLLRPENKKSRSKDKKKPKQSSNHPAHGDDKSDDRNDDTEEQEKAQGEFANTRESQALISWFHVMNKRLAQIDTDPTLSATEKGEKKKVIQSEIDAKGGLEKYQRASIYGASTIQNNAFSSAVWVMNFLESRHHPSHITNAHNDELEIDLLDVGAIDNQYLPWQNKEKQSGIIKKLALIDLVPQHPSVAQCDFFDYAHYKITGHPAPSSLPISSIPHNVIVLSLVINYLGDPRRRGDMLCLCAHNQMLRLHGMLFIVIPVMCLKNSRYCLYESFVDELLQKTLGFKLKYYKETKKLALIALEKARDDVFDTPNAAPSGPGTDSVRRHGNEKRKRDGVDYHEEPSVLRHPIVKYDSESRALIFKPEAEIKRTLYKSGTNHNNFAVLLRNHATQP